MKLLLTSFMPSPEHDRELARMVGAPIEGIRVAYIENAHDIYDDEQALEEGRAELRAKGYQVQLLDLREYRDDAGRLRQRLEGADVLLLAGGNPYHLRSLMRETGADQMIVELVGNGTVYCGASAAAVVAGPTLRYFDELDDPSVASTLVWEGLGLTDIVVAPHIDNPDFGAGCRASGDRLEAEGYRVVRITDAQALLIDGAEERVI